jgi:flagellar basal body rod protein FlgB
MSGMAYNAVKYNALASVVAKEFQLLKSVAQAK